ncbi:holin family protein [Bacillus phage vB_BceS-M2]|nr:hypothetical protein PBC5_031 [Bacillus phage PBC5]
MQEITMIEKIAGSQFVWAIVAIGLGYGIYRAGKAFITNIQEQNTKREEQLFELYEKQKKDSDKRERDIKAEARERELESRMNQNKLMEHLEKTTETMENISISLESLQEEMSNTNIRIDDVYKLIGEQNKDARSGH